MNDSPPITLCTFTRGVAPLLCAAILLVLVGCGAGDDAGPGVPPDSVRGEGVITGRVTLQGTPPPRLPVKNEPCHDASKPILDETVVVGPDGGLANVFVYLEGGPRVDGRSLTPVTLDQVNCQYVPHVVGVVVGQPLAVKSSDPTFHNTHYTPRRNPAANFGLRDAGHLKTVRFTASEIFHVRCDVHPWMSAYIGVFDNPFFAATGDDGRFRIAGVPPGDYTLVAWHELYGQQRQAVQVTRGSGATPLEFNLSFHVP